MADTYAASRFIIWSEYILKKDNGGTGWPRQSTYTKLVQIRGGIGYDPQSNEQAEIVDKFMTQLKRDNKQLFGIMSMLYCIKWVDVGNGIDRAMYTNLCNQKHVAEHFGCAQSTISDKIHKGHQLLIDFMHDCMVKG